MIRSDNEAALLQVVDTAFAALKAKGVASNSEGSVPYDPQTNGAAENAARLLKGSLRASLMSFERQLQARIPLNHPVSAWLEPYTESVRTMRIRGPDGRTAHQRGRGLSASIRLIPFRQMCRYKVRWSVGTYLGVEHRTGQYVVHDHESQTIRHARTIAQVSEPMKWSVDRIKEMVTTPLIAHEPTEPVVIDYKTTTQVETTKKSINPT